MIYLKTPLHSQALTCFHSLHNSYSTLAIYVYKYPEYMHVLVSWNMYAHCRKSTFGYTALNITFLNHEFNHFPLDTTPKPLVLTSLCFCNPLQLKGAPVSTTSEQRKHRSATSSSRHVLLLLNSLHPPLSFLHMLDWAHANGRCWLSSPDVAGGCGVFKDGWNWLSVIPSNSLGFYLSGLR